MEQLSNAELARIYGNYLGCQILDPKGRIATLFGMGKSYSKIEYHAGPMEGQMEDFSFKNTKLALLPSSEISDEDAIEVAKICRFEVDDKIAHGRTLVKVIFSESGIELKIPMRRIFDVINYLRSKGYDCDNLIERGIACDIRTIK